MSFFKDDFFLLVQLLYSTLLLLPPIRLGDSIASEDAGIALRTVTIRHWLSVALSTPLDLIHHSARSHPQKKDIIVFTMYDTESTKIFFYDFVISLEPGYTTALTKIVEKLKNGFVKWHTAKETTPYTEQSY
jgi:hypothetical protein